MIKWMQAICEAATVQVSVWHAKVYVCMYALAMCFMGCNAKFQVFLDVLIVKVTDWLKLHVIVLPNAEEALEYTCCLCP